MSDDNIIKALNDVSYTESEIEKYINLAEEDDKIYQSISGAMKSKFAVDNLKNVCLGVENELENDEKIEKIIKVRNIKAINAITVSSMAGGTMCYSLDYGVFDELFFTNKRILFANTNVINQELRQKFVKIEDILGIVFTNKVVKVEKDKNNSSKIRIRTSKIKIAAIIYSIISIIGFFVARELRIESLGIFFMSTGFVTILYCILKSIEDKIANKFNIVLKDGTILNGIVGNNNYFECVTYLKDLDKKINSKNI